MPLHPLLHHPIARSSRSSLRNGLVLYLPMNETATSGNVTSADDSGNGFDFTSVNSTLSTSGVVGNGRSFVKANVNYLLGSSTSNLLAFGESDWSLAFWVRFSTLPTTSVNQSILTRNVSSNGAFAASEFGLQIFSSTSVVQWTVSGANNVTFVDTANLTTSTWYHIAFTNSGTRVSYYRNGAFVASGTRTGTWLSGARHMVVGIPNTNAAASQALDGSLDELCKWSRAIRPDEVSALYNGGAGRTLKA